MARNTLKCNNHLASVGLKGLKVRRRRQRPQRLNHGCIGRCRCTLHRAVNKLPAQLRKQQFVVGADSAAADAVNFVRTHVGRGA